MTQINRRVSIPHTWSKRSPIDDIELLEPHDPAAGDPAGSGGGNRGDPSNTGTSDSDPGEGSSKHDSETTAPAGSIASDEDPLTEAQYTQRGQNVLHICDERINNHWPDLEYPNYWERYSSKGGDNQPLKDDSLKDREIDKIFQRNQIPPDAVFDQVKLNRHGVDDWLSPVINAHYSKDH